MEAIKLMLTLVYCSKQETCEHCAVYHECKEKNAPPRLAKRTGYVIGEFKWRGVCAENTTEDAEK